MADVKNNYVSKYSGDQLDAAIAALGSLKNLFITSAQFNEFIKGTEDENGNHIDGFNNKMDKLDKSVETMTKTAGDAATNATNALQTANYASASVIELSKKDLIQYEEITD